MQVNALDQNNCKLIYWYILRESTREKRQIEGKKRHTHATNTITPIEEKKTYRREWKNRDKHAR